MKPRRRLVLTRERLTRLDPHDLRAVVAASHVPCVTHGYTCDYCATPTTPIASCMIERPTTIRTADDTGTNPERET